MSDLDVELEDGTGDEPYLAHLAHSLELVFHAHDPRSCSISPAPIRSKATGSAG